MDHDDRREGPPAGSVDDPTPGRLLLHAPGLWAMVIVHGCALLALLPAAAPTASILAWTGVAFAVRMFALSAGFHRYFAHRAFKMGRVLQFVFAFVGGMAALRGALWWASQHRQHHACSDGLGDPHSPRRGWLWSHLLWFMADGNQHTRRELVGDFAKHRELIWLDDHEWVPVLVFSGGCLALGGFAGWVWVANVSTVLLYHAEFSINSVSHRWGRRRYETSDDSRNHWLVALLTFGEGWHNNHHRFPARARLGEGAQVDISWWGIRLLERLGLVRDVQR